MIRLFAAVAIPEEIGKALVPLQAGLEGARWRPIEAFHITLRFFGDIAENVADDVDEALAEVGGRSFEVSLNGVGAFGEGRDLRAVWAGVEASEPLRRLAARCETAARRAGLKADPRKYAPHVTLAYLKGAAEADVAAWIAKNNLLRTAGFKVEGFGLYSSWATKSGSSYRLEQTYALA
jgi:2'-5' RNA ligase